MCVEILKASREIPLSTSKHRARNISGRMQRQKVDGLRIKGLDVWATRTKKIYPEMKIRVKSSQIVALISSIKGPRPGFNEQEAKKAEKWNYGYWKDDKRTLE